MPRGTALRHFPGRVPSVQSWGTKASVAGSPFTMAQPSGYTFVRFRAIGSGAGGAGGRRGAAAEASAGASGSGGGGVSDEFFRVADIAWPVTITVPAGGTAAGVTSADSTDGNPAGDGGVASVVDNNGKILVSTSTAFAGGKGQAALSATPGSGGSGTLAGGVGGSNSSTGAGGGSGVTNAGASGGGAGGGLTTGNAASTGGGGGAVSTKRSQATAGGGA